MDRYTVAQRYVTRLFQYWQNDPCATACNNLFLTASVCMVGKGLTESPYRRKYSSYWVFEIWIPLQTLTGTCGSLKCRGYTRLYTVNNNTIISFIQQLEGTYIDPAGFSDGPGGSRRRCHITLLPTYRHQSGYESHTGWSQRWLWWPELPLTPSSMWFITSHWIHPCTSCTLIQQEQQL